MKRGTLLSEDSMADDELDKGCFLFSLDTELAWGYFDFDELRPQLFSLNGQRERRSIRQVLSLMNRYQIVGTWALVGHLFYQRCEQCESCPILKWKGVYGTFNEVFETAHTLWYGLDAIEPLIRQRNQHELAFHGYTHELFDESTMSSAEAKIEIDEWQRASQRARIVPQSVVFPRNRIGYLELFKDAGYICYRGAEPELLTARWGKLHPWIKTLDHILGISIPPLYTLKDIRCLQHSSGMINLPASQYIFGFNRRVERMLDTVNLHTLRVRRIVRAIRKAAAEKKIIHLWAHPWEFQTDQDLEKLDTILSAVAREVQQGRMISTGMANVARLTIKNEELKDYEQFQSPHHDRYARS